jgi:ubiquitin-like modifier-activating enzyme ATG7
LDQQCTVTRPGISYVASAFAVELLVSMLQISNSDPESNCVSRLGKIPHQIRGNLSNQEVFNLTGSAFENCTCCSEAVLNEFAGNSFEFIKRVCNSPSELETISGLKDLKQITCDLNDFVVSSDKSGDENDF